MKSITIEVEIIPSTLLKLEADRLHMTLEEALLEVVSITIPPEMGSIEEVIA